MPERVTRRMAGTVEDCRPWSSVTSRISRPPIASTTLTDRYRRDDGRVFLSGVAGARPPALRAAARRSGGRAGTRRRTSPAIQGSPLGRVRPRHLGRRAARRCRWLADRVPAGHERRAGSHGRDGLAAQRHARLVPVRRRDRHLVRQGARARPGQRCHSPRRVRRHLQPRWRRGAGGRRSHRQELDAALVQRRHARRPAHAGAVPGRRAAGGRSRPPRRRVVACVAVCGPRSRWSSRSPTAPAPSSWHPDRIVPIIPTIEVDGKPFVPRPSGHLITPYTLELEREFHDVRLELARRYGVVNDLNRIVGPRPERLDRHRRVGQHVPRGARGAARAWSAHRRRPARRRRAVAQARHADPARSPPPSARSPTGSAEVMVVEDKNPTLEWP